MSVRKLVVGPLGVLLVGLLLVSLGCEIWKEYDYYADTEKGGPSTAQSTDLPTIMKQMRTANLYLVDALVYMDQTRIMQYSVTMYNLANGVKLTQPAVALSGPDELAVYKKNADDLAEIIVTVGAAARDKRFDYADANYAHAFLQCNRCHLRFRAQLGAELPTLPEAPMTPGAVAPPETPMVPPAPAVPPVPAPMVPPAPAPVPGQ